MVEDICRVQESSGEKIQCCCTSEVTDNARFHTSTTTLLKIRLHRSTEARSGCYFSYAFPQLAKQPQGPDLEVLNLEWSQKLCCLTNVSMRTISVLVFLICISRFDWNVDVTILYSCPHICLPPPPTQADAEAVRELIRGAFARGTMPSAASAGLLSHCLVARACRIAALAALPAHAHAAWPTHRRITRACRIASPHSYLPT